MLSPSSLLLIHGLSCFFLCGLIWTVQFVHYPSFSFVKENKFADFHRFHVQRITWVVGPAMLIELITGIFLMGYRPEKISLLFVSVNLIFILMIWLSTAAWAVPQHGRMETQFEPAAHRSLMKANGFRSLLWSIRSLALGFVLFKTLT